MKKSSLFALWGVLYIICAGLGFIPSAEGSTRIFLLCIAVLFFVPPMLLLIDARRSGDRKTLRTLRLLSAVSLGGTLAMIAAGILSAFGSQVLGDVLHVLLVLISAPMLCSGYWAVSLFLWAVILVGSKSV